MNDISHMTGESNFNAPRAMTLDEIKLVGNSIGKVGGYFRTIELTGQKNEEGKFPTDRLEKGTPLQLVFLIVRRRLVQASQDGMVRWTSEHDTPNDIVQLFGEGKDKAPATEFKIRHEKLRTEQVVYVRCKGKIMRLRVKGLSLKPTGDRDGYMSFYPYLQSFKEGEHFYQFATKLTPIEVQTDTGPNWSIAFDRGERLSDEQIKIVIEDIKAIYTANKKVDEFYNRAEPRHVGVSDTAPAVNENSDYPTEEIDPDDIPF